MFYNFNLYATQIRFMQQLIKYLVITFCIFMVSVANAQDGWIAKYSNAQSGTVVHEGTDSNYLVAGLKGIDLNSILMLKINQDGAEMQRHIIRDINAAYSFQSFEPKFVFNQQDDLIFGATAKDSTAIYLAAIDKQAQPKWQSSFSIAQAAGLATIKHFQGDVIATTKNEARMQNQIVRLSNDGNVVWQKPLRDSLEVIDVAVHEPSSKILIFSKGKLLINEEEYEVYFISKYNEQGQEESLHLIALDYVNFNFDFNDILINNEEKILIAGGIRMNSSNDTNSQTIVANIGVDGSVNDLDVFQPFNDRYTVAHKIVDGIDGYLVCGASWETDDVSRIRSYYLKKSAAGLVEWYNNDPSYAYGNELHDAIVTIDSFYLIVGRSNQTYGGVQVIKANQKGKIYTSRLKGYVFSDVDGNCTRDEEEFKFRNALIEIRDIENEITVYKRYNNFEFDINIRQGKYLIKPVFFDDVWQSNCDSVYVEIDSLDEIIELQLPLEPLFECPLMTVDLTTPILQECGESMYKIAAFNNGSINAEDAYLELTLDPTIDIIQSTSPYVETIEGIYRFELGTMTLGEGRIIDLLVNISCDSTILGQTHCAIANVYPDTICYEVDPQWDGSVIDINGACLGDSIGFQISNDGAARMLSPRIFLIVEDDAIFRSGSFQLESGERLTVYVPSNGSTYRLETEENPGFIFEGRPSYTVEGCGVDIEEASLGYVNQFPMYDNAPFVSIDCQESISSLQGNLHLAYPKGYTSENYIRRGDELEYLIRFESIETTASEVIVIDTIDSNLDMTTLSIGVTSHPYDVAIDGNVVRFTFDNINLNKTDASNSYGFVKFKIKQLPNLANGTIITNKVTLEIDEAMQTTQDVVHTIGEDLKLSIENITRANFKISNFPNPFVERTIIQLPNDYLSEWTFKLYSVAGELVKTKTFNSPRGIFERGHLQAGLYLFTIEDEAGLIGSGKLTIGR